MDSLEEMDEEAYDIHCSERTWSVVLSDGTPLELQSGGSDAPVLYSERLQYAEQAREARMNESDQQVSLTSR